MKKMLIGVLMAGVVTFAGASLASAQDDPTLVKVPFKFIVAGKLLPAGTYRIAKQAENPSLLMITPADTTGAGAFTETIGAGVTAPDNKPVHVQFKNIDGQYFLSQVAMPGEDVRLVNVTKVEAERALVKLNLMPAEHADATSK